MTQAQDDRFQSRNKDKSLLDGHSLAIQKVSDLIFKAAKTSTAVLILGESGTGKELVARSIHISSNRREFNFVSVNCAAIPKGLLESELFGHKKGAFTGAIADRKGRFELADQGTIFLDEIGDMDLSMQAKLLHVLQEKSIERVGENNAIAIDVRIVAASHHNLAKKVDRGEFREDLFNRLNVFPIQIPPLRRRTEDLPALTYAITEKIKNESNIKLSIKPDAIHVLTKNIWPGNVRELSNLLERLSMLYPNQEIGVHELPEKYRSLDNTRLDENISRKSSCTPLTDHGINLRKALNQVEISFINQALLLSGGVTSKAAELLGLRRTTLVEKIKRYNLNNCTSNN